MKQNEKLKAMKKETLKYHQIFKGIYTPFNLEKIMADRLKLGMELTGIREAAEYFYKVGQMNRNERNWFVNTDIEILKECYL